MNGFHTQGSLRPDRLIRNQRTITTLTGIAMCLSLCVTSGCALTRGVWSGLHRATCGEPGSHCDCTCGECAADVHVEDAGNYQDPHLSQEPASSRRYAATPMSPEGSRPIPQGIRQQPAKLNGVPGIWIPTTPTTQFEFEDQTTAHAANPSHFHADPDFVANSESPVMQSPAPQQQLQWPVMQPTPAICPPDTKPERDPLMEYRTQVQILSQQISQMKDAQDSMKASQETLQQSHEREILELKLQQVTSDRDRLTRERELEQQLEKQQQRELDTIDSLSQIIEDVVPSPVSPSPATSPAPRLRTQASQVQSTAPTQLPPVDASL